ncbi:methionyl-tRNA formyltransferase [Vagococcus xieshaowenii]|uniref:Methionyl-tRNA formyltransferase n=1 Tax=Vagococcus xieshaowenii TaxID=2562451 RepID=A0AAJ5EE79_9ENTE|nr:methionyl-tRNA formyltransferase [Vagococcus xieshaowenii]QCA28934.1 methionyl-tRNA formyltransferase [Vagococcus xieshaowenii]TFZ39254.1 methionyl-tRNA formyltransferase [Vagococcus xieshaowenii]
MTKIVFMGTPAFSVPILEGLIKNGYEILAVVTQPDRPVGRKKILTPPPVKEAALKHGLEILQPEKISGSTEMARVIELAPDLIVTAAFGQFLPESLLNAPTYGAVNVHASLLPKYRGGAPVHYAIMNGEKETGVTIMRMVKQMDAGDILTQRSIAIESNDNVGSMFDKLSQVGHDLLLETLPELLAGNITPVQQREEEATYSPNISREQEQIDWNKSAQAVDWQVRGMYPWPVAYTMNQENRWKILGGFVGEETTDASIGTIVAIDKKDFSIACGNQSVYHVTHIQPAGKGSLTAQEFINGVGRQTQIGDQLN